MSSKTDITYRTDKLYTLATVLNKKEMLPRLNRMARKQFGEDMGVRNLEIEVVRQRNQRCVIRYRVRARSSLGENGVDWRVIGKVYKRNRGERVFEMMQQLWDCGFSDRASDGIHVPKPYEFSSSLCILFQEEVPGLSAKLLIKQSPDPAYIRQLARVMAKLHRSNMKLGKPMTVQDHLMRCHPRYPFLGLAVAGLEKEIDYIVECAKSMEALLHEQDCTPIHGDFHLGQLHMQNGNSWLIDFDALSYGDPAADMGNLLVFLKSKSRKNPEFKNLIEAFLDEYFSIMDIAIKQRIPLYEGLTHLRRACKCLRYQQAGWKSKVTRMIEQGKTCIQEMEKATKY